MQTVMSVTKCSQEIPIFGIVRFVTVDARFSPNFRQNLLTPILLLLELCNIL